MANKRPQVFVSRHETDEMKDKVICRNCGRVEYYGKMINHTGHTACPVCYESMRNEIVSTKESNYAQYIMKPHFYQLSKEDYIKRIQQLLGIDKVPKEVYRGE
jgi:protein-arginine kinase activator protein McsA